MPGTQYTGYIFDIATLVVHFSESKISCSIRTVPKTTINSDAFKFAISTLPWLPGVVTILAMSSGYT